MWMHYLIEIVKTQKVWKLISSMYLLASDFTCFFRRRASKWVQSGCLEVHLGSRGNVIKLSITEHASSEQDQTLSCASAITWSRRGQQGDHLEKLGWGYSSACASLSTRPLWRWVHRLEWIGLDPTGYWANRSPARPKYVFGRPKKGDYFQRSSLTESCLFLHRPDFPVSVLSWAWWWEVDTDGSLWATPPSCLRRPLRRSCPLCRAWSGLSVPVITASLRLKRHLLPRNCFRCNFLIRKYIHMVQNESKLSSACP